MNFTIAATSRLLLCLCFSHHGLCGAGQGAAKAPPDARSTSPSSLLLPLPAVGTLWGNCPPRGLETHHREISGKLNAVCVLRSSRPSPSPNDPFLGLFPAGAAGVGAAPPMPPNLRGTGIASVVEDAGDAACGLWGVRGKDVLRGLRIDPLGLCM